MQWRLILATRHSSPQTYKSSFQIDLLLLFVHFRSLIIVIMTQYKSVAYGQNLLFPLFASEAARNGGGSSSQLLNFLRPVFLFLSARLSMARRDRRRRRRGGNRWRSLSTVCVCTATTRKQTHTHKYIHTKAPLKRKSASSNVCWNGIRLELLPPSPSPKIKFQATANRSLCPLLCWASYLYNITWLPDVWGQLRNISVSLYWKGKRFRPELPLLLLKKKIYNLWVMVLTV